MAELCGTVSYSSPHSLGLPQTASDNDVAYSIMGVNAAGAGRVESADVSTERGDNMRLKLNLCDRRKSATTPTAHACFNRQECGKYAQSGGYLLKSCFSQLIYFSGQGRACLPDLGSACAVSVGEK